MLCLSFNALSDEARIATELTAESTEETKFCTFVREEEVVHELAGLAELMLELGP